MVTNTEIFRPKAYSYIRMSTEIQLKGDSLRRQAEVSRKYAEAHGLELDQDFDLTDVGKSGFTGENITSGNFGRFLTAVREGRITKGAYLLVESLDRMSRQEPMLALQPFMDIVKAGINLVTLDDERVFSGKISFEDLIISIAKMSRANEESVRKSDRLNKAWENKRANAKTTKLTARCPSWLRLADDRKIFVQIPDRVAVVRRIYSDAIAGLGAYSIVRALNAEMIPTFKGGDKWRTSSVANMLSNRAVIGILQPNRMVGGKREPDGPPVIDYFPAIISVETFESAQRSRLSRRSSPTGERKGSGGRKGLHYANLFSKLAVCAYCKKPMQFQNKGKPPKGGTYLVCSTAIRNGGCNANGHWRYDHFETAFLSFVEKLDLASLVSTEQVSSKRDELTRQLEAAEGTQLRLERELALVYTTSQKLTDGSDFLARKITECEPGIQTAKETQQKLRHEMSALHENQLIYYRNTGHMNELIDKVRATRGIGVFKIRAQIASRLQLLIEALELTVPNDAEDDQRFEVSFRDGASLLVFVDSTDPKKVLQVVRRDETGAYIMTDGAGEFIDRYTFDEPSEIFGH